MAGKEFNDICQEVSQTIKTDIYTPKQKLEGLRGEL